ncbi:MAG: LLM class flavin-dependent oxidoreductase, partial [Deltaproteobacteria bacterium]|nr:LLM class flavin-dependent oxidoreductase [Deltaproteobacteria bacterium]
MPVSTTMRLNMTGHSDDPQEQADRYRAAIEMAAYADANGFSVVSVEEHHCARNGWLPSPITLAAMIIARTERIAVNIAALLVTLYDPIRLAEDIAVLDLASAGRFSFVAGLGYRPIEYHALDKDWEMRGQLMDHVIETLLEAAPGTLHGNAPSQRMQTWGEVGAALAAALDALLRRQDLVALLSAQILDVHHALLAGTRNALALPLGVLRRFAQKVGRQLSPCALRILVDEDHRVLFARLGEESLLPVALELVEVDLLELGHLHRRKEGQAEARRPAS